MAELNAASDRHSIEPSKSWYSVDEAAAGLGVNRKTLYESIQRGEVPGAVRLGRIFRIPGNWLKG